MRRALSDTAFATIHEDDPLPRNFSFLPRHNDSFRTVNQAPSNEDPVSVPITPPYQSPARSPPQSPRETRRREITDEQLDDICAILDLKKVSDDDQIFTSNTPCKISVSRGLLIYFLQFFVIVCIVIVSLIGILNNPCDSELEVYVGLLTFCLGLTLPSPLQKN
jgi:hypothetical protein